MKTTDFDDAVSPVVGVMLMLVVTIVIAAVVSGFAGSITSEQEKTPQATITGTFSIADGLTIRHIGGDPLPMHDIDFVLWDGPTFGPDAETVTRQVVNISLMSDASGTPIIDENGVYQVRSFVAGDSLFIDSDNCTPNNLQPNIAPSDYDEDDGIAYKGSYPNRWGLCLRNPGNIGNQFVFSISSKSGGSIARTAITVAG